MKIWHQSFTVLDDVPHYRDALRIRRERFAPEDVFTWVERTDEILVFERAGVQCLVNFGHQPLPLPGGEIILASDDLTDGSLPTDAAAWVLAHSDD